MSIEITLRSLAKQANMSYQALCNDVKRNILKTRWDGNHHMMSIDDPIVRLILENPEEYKKIRLTKHRKFHRVKYKEKEYSTVSELARSLNMSRETAYRKLRQGVIESLKEEN